jgi:hypothetical protein
MILWMSSESTTAIGDEFRLSRNAFEKFVNKCLPAIPVQDWKKWAVIFIILPDDFGGNYNETRRLSKKDMCLDFRAKIDFESAKNADFNKFLDLMVAALETTIPYFKKADIDLNTQEKIRLCIRLAAEEAKAENTSKH